MLNMQFLAGLEPDAVNSAEATTVDSVDPEVTERHHVVRTSGNHNSIGPTRQYRSNLTAAAVDGNGFGDGDHTEPARIEGVDFASKCGFRKGASKSLAGCCAPAGFGIIAIT